MTIDDSADRGGRESRLLMNDLTMGLHFRTRSVFRRNKGGSSAGPLTAVRHGHATWIIRESWRENILAADAPDWFHVDRGPHAECVESGWQRAVWRVDRDGRRVFAKVVRETGLRNRIKAWLLGTHAEREWRMVMSASAAGVPTPTAIAVGVCDAASMDNVFLTEAFPNAATLSETWTREVPSTFDARRRLAVRRLTDVVARLLATSHRRGFAHRDGHPNNILIAANTGDNWEAAFVDTHGSRLGRGPIARRLTVRALAHLDQYFHRLATRSERMRFLQAYQSYLTPGAAIAEGCLDRRRLAAQVQTERRRHAARLAKRRDKRLRGTGSYFARLELGGGWRASVATKLERRHVFPEAAVPDRTAAQWRELLASLPNDGVGFEKAGPHVGDGRVSFEWATFRGLLERIRSTFAASKHRRAFEGCHRRRHRDLSAALVLGYAEHRVGGLVDATVLLRPASPEARQGGSPTD